MTGPFPYPPEDPRAHGVEELHRLHAPSHGSAGHPERMGDLASHEERRNPSRGWGIVGIAVVVLIGLVFAAMLVGMAIVLAT
ncbi:DUF6480 family protein [Yinghuangia sp. YIM S10712]|uniref:DUF6480 family protein n=1 Tax=Yinghuangia sp. YIM S10712 TaxID=3436930 RepID=UPI003F52F2DB